MAPHQRTIGPSQLRRLTELVRAQGEKLIDGFSAPVADDGLVDLSLPVAVVGAGTASKEGRLP
jgi:hypothetical protein